MKTIAQEISGQMGWGLRFIGMVEAFMCQDGSGLARGQIVVSVKLHIDEPLIVPQVQVSLPTIVEDIGLSMLVPAISALRATFATQSARDRGRLTGSLFQRLR